MMTDYGDLSTTELAKQINADYELILESERTTLQRYLAMGEKLIALRPRIAPKHGEWQAKLKLHCPQVSYETANLCIRFVENFGKLEAYSATKNVKVTDLGIDEARKALAKPKSNTDKTDKGKPASVLLKVALRNRVMNQHQERLRLMQRWKAWKLMRCSTRCVTCTRTGNTSCLS